MAEYLPANGLDVIGIDVSPAMLVEARRTHPDIKFEEGCVDDLPIPGGSNGPSVATLISVPTRPTCRSLDAS